VIALKLRSRPRDFAIDAFRNGRSSDCLAALHGHDDPACRFVAARAALRLLRPDLVLDELEPIDETDLLSAGRAEFFLLRALALTGLGRFEEARAALELARVHAYGTPSAALEADLHVATARYAFAGNDFTTAGRAAEAALAVTPCALDRGDYFIPLCHSRARALHTLGVVEAAGGRYAAQLSLLRAAIGEFGSTGVPDAWTSANLLMNLSFYVRDFDLADEAGMLRQEIAHPWPGDLDVQRFYILRSLGWSSALRGDHLGAFREFRAAVEIAPTPALKVWALADRAYLGNELGEPTFARDELERAADLASRIEWNTILGDDRAALLHLAKQTAAVAPARARALFENYRRVKSKLSPDVLNKIDRRLRAHEFFADGIISRGENARDAAREKLTCAFEIWSAIDYRWQAATAAIELAELGCGTFYREYAVREAAARPRSWLARHVENLPA
jgi:tetratricopeptide (TPR) repeat protein